MQCIQLLDPPVFPFLADAIDRWFAMQNDHTLERALAQFEDLMHLRPTFVHHNSVLVSIDHAIGNVFEDQNYDEVSRYIIKIRELVDFVEKMNELGVGTTGIELPRPNLHISGAQPQYKKINAKYEQLKDVRHRLVVLGIPTVGIEAAIANVLMVINICPSSFCTQLTEPPNRSMA